MKNEKKIISLIATPAACDDRYGSGMDFYTPQKYSLAELKEGKVLKIGDSSFSIILDVVSEKMLSGNIYQKSDYNEDDYEKSFGSFELSPQQARFRSPIQDVWSWTWRTIFLECQLIRIRNGIFFRKIRLA